MQPSLTVAIPTYNRASLLGDQLTWFARAVAGREHVVELLVSDNCSSEETPDVTARWARTMAVRNVDARFLRNDENIGAIRNIASCVEQARGRYVWVVSDDDTVDEGALRFVLKTIEEHPDLALLVLNFSSRHWRTRELKYERCFEVACDLVEPNGKELVERFLSHPNSARWGGLVLTTALVYRTDAAQAALRAWPEAVQNLTMQLFLTASCAQQGTTILTGDTHIEMSSGRHFFMQDKSLAFRFQVADVPEAFVKLAEIGYSRALCRQKIRHQLRASKRLLVQNLVGRPFTALRVLARYMASTRML